MRSIGMSACDIFWSKFNFFFSREKGNVLRHSMSSSIIATVWACCEKMCENINVTSMFTFIVLKPEWTSRRVWRCQRGNQNLYIDDEPTTQWPKEKVQKDKQRSTKHTHKTNDRVTRTPLKSGIELRKGKLFLLH
jgi:hypothetical protein